MLGMNDISPYVLSEQLTEELRNSLYPSEHPLLAQLLYTRGVTDKKDIDALFAFSYSDLHDPFLFKDMDVAVDRVLKAIKKNEKICVYTDYDTDGIPAGALLYTFFTKIGYKNFFNYIPHRNKEGYSLNMTACKAFVEDKVELIITADCGITDIEEVAYLTDNGVDVIITDHHLPGETLPNALAVIDHKVPDNTYPDVDLCGCAVAWKLVVALIHRGKELNIIGFGEIPEGWEKTLLDLVAISTICDMVPLVGENRLLVHFGMRVLSLTRRAGLQKIIKNSGLSEISVDDVAFMIGPRINAASRLEDPMISFTALAKNDSEGVAAANDLEKINTLRKTKSATIMRSVWKKLESRELGPVIVIGDRSWPLGILGLIANKIAERYQRPTFVWSELEGKIKGSCRSGSDISVHSLMDHSSESFSHFGGHAASGGFVTTPDKIVILERELSKNIERTDRIEQEQQPVDMNLLPRHISQESYDQIEKLKPFGMSYPKPLFSLTIDTYNTRTFGKNSEHLEIQIPQERGFARATAFYCPEFIEIASGTGPITIIGNIIKDTYNGVTRYGMRIIDIV